MFFGRHAILFIMFQQTVVTSLEYNNTILENVPKQLSKTVLFKAPVCLTQPSFIIKPLT